MVLKTKIIYPLILNPSNSNLFNLSQGIQIRRVSLYMKGGRVILSAFCKFYIYISTVYSGYSGHIYSGHSDKVATFPGTKYIYFIIFMSDIVASRI